MAARFSRCPKYKGQQADKARKRNVAPEGVKSGQISKEAPPKQQSGQITAQARRADELCGKDSHYSRPFVVWK